MMLKSKIYEGHLTHARTAPVKHNFSFPIYTFVLDLDELDALDKNVRFFGYNRGSVFSLYDSDHLGSGKGSIKEKLKDNYVEIVNQYYKLVDEVGKEEDHYKFLYEYDYLNNRINSESDPSYVSDSESCGSLYDGNWKTNLERTFTYDIDAATGNITLNGYWFGEDSSAVKYYLYKE
mgnify:CR=1 FL=1